MSNRTSKPNISKRGATYTWYAYITAGDGRRRQIGQGGFRTIAEAEHARIKKLTELGHGDYVTPDRITLATFLLDEWLPARRIDLEPSTWRSYEQKSPRSSDQSTHVASTGGRLDHSPAADVPRPQLRDGGSSPHTMERNRKAVTCNQFRKWVGSEPSSPPARS